MCEALAWRDAWPAGKAEDGAEPPTPSRWLLLSLGLCPLWVSHGWLLRTLQILTRTSLPRRGARLSHPRRTLCRSTCLASPAALRNPQKLHVDVSPEVCLSWFSRSPSPQGHMRIHNAHVWREGVSSPCRFSGHLRFPFPSIISLPLWVP